MLPLRFCLIGVGLIVLAFGALWAIAPSPGPQPFWAYDATAVAFTVHIFYSLFGAGLFCIARGGWLALAKDRPARRLPRIFPELPLRNVTGWNKRAPSKSLVPAMLNAFSVSWICVLMSQVILFMAFQPEPRRGLWVSWDKPQSVAATESPWPQTMSVFVGYPGQFYVNGKTVTRERFEGTLREELSRNVEWTVYVEADPGTRFMDTVFAIDTIQGLGGKVVWITPKMRQEWQRDKSRPTP